MQFRLIFVLLFVLLSACGGGSSSSGGSHDKENLILVLSDSIGTGHSASISFPDVLQNLTGIPVLNASKPSINAEEGVSHAPGLIQTHNPKFIVALLGTNNALGAPGGVGGAIHAMETLALICKDNGIVCIIGTLPPLTISSNSNEDARSISNGYRELITIDDTRIADNNAVMNGSHISSDGIHPNNSGQQVIAETFATQLL